MRTYGLKLSESALANRVPSGSFSRPESHIVSAIGCCIYLGAWKGGYSKVSQDTESLTGIKVMEFSKLSYKWILKFSFRSCQITRDTID
jgi:hypothetical protein